ncbi:MAG: D-alanyl-D-alanine carboxypeptidase [Clostridia bacterium]|nr:D-alanyl-D-alanine carboxypeptidase [Clostridia bacterium]
MYDSFETQPIAPTAAEAQQLTVSATAAVLMERVSGTVLFEKNPDEKRPPASITKIMTLLLTMEAVESGKIALTDRVVATAHACSMGGSQIWLEEGEVMTVDHLIKAVCVASANDAAVALGEHLAGSEEAFVTLMNQRAKQLNMTGTHFVNCCGLDAPDHYTTARDIAIMSRELIAHPLITEYSTIWMDTLRDGTTELVNTNKLVRFYEGATGLKTGTTDDAGFCVSATATRDGMDLIAVVLDGSTSDQRFADAKQLLNYGFANWTLAKVDPSQTMPPNLKVTGGATNTVTVCTPEPQSFLVKKGAAQHITSKLEFPPSVPAPIAAGQRLGTIIYYADQAMIGQVPLLAEQSVNRLTFPLAVLKLLQHWIQL